MEKCGRVFVSITLWCFIAQFSVAKAQDTYNAYCGVSCDAAPNCFSRNRHNCVPPAVTCGKCIDGYVSGRAELQLGGNSPCLSQNEDSKSDFVDIPLLDLDALLYGKEEEKLRAFHSLRKLCQGHGFAYLVNHGVSLTLLDKAMSDAKKFFALSMEEKEAYTWNNNIGYIKAGSEVLDEDTYIGDPKESYDMNKDHILTSQLWKNSTFAQFCDEMETLEGNMLKLLSEAIRLWLPGGESLDDDLLASKHREKFNTFRILNYIPLENDKTQRCGAHTDYGSFSFIVQDEVGGLEMFNRHLGIWQPVPPMPGTIIINLADLLSRWTNDEFVSTLHRVVSYNNDEINNNLNSCPAGTRTSLAYFVQPDENALIDSSEIFNQNIVAAKYQPITSAEYLNCRLSVTIPTA